MSFRPRPPVVVVVPPRPPVVVVSPRPPVVVVPSRPPVVVVPSRPPVVVVPPRPRPNQRTSFPELVGRSTQEAVSIITAHGLNPVVVRPNQPMTMDFQSNRVRIVTGPLGQRVIETPTVG